MEKHRPLGVTAIVILTLIGGIAFFAIGMILLVVGIGFILMAVSITKLNRCPLPKGSRIYQ